jgi:uncharacterized protein (UPF0332 family)
MSLRDWLQNNRLIKHDTSSQEISELLGVADRDILDCQLEGLSTDWRMSIAYNAALRSATAALAAAGYRATRDAHHYRIIQSLAHTIGVDTKMIAQFDRFRKKRNIGGYERAGMVSEREAEEMIELAKTLREQVEKWINENHPDLLSK